MRRAAIPEVWAPVRSHVGQNAGLRLDFVTGGNTTYTDGNDINNLSYTAHNETIKDAGFSLVQTNPNNASLDITVSAFNSDNNDQQALFRTATSVNDASAVNISGVLVKDAAGQVIEDTRAGGTDSPSYRRNRSWHRHRDYHRTAR